MNIVFMCFMYGPIMPLVFPVGLLALSVLYSVERLMIAYSYCKPPMIDTDIIANTVFVMRLAPVLYYLVAMWAFSSQVVFQNHVKVNDGSSIFDISSHTFKDLYAHITPGTPLMIFGIFNLLTMFGRCGQQLWGNLVGKEEEEKLAQYLDSYFSVLRRDFKNEIATEESVGIKRLGLIPHNQEGFTKLKKGSKYNGPRLQGLPTYDLLGYHTYKTRFCYVGC